MADISPPVAENFLIKLCTKRNLTIFRNYPQIRGFKMILEFPMDYNRGFMEENVDFFGYHRFEWTGGMQTTIGPFSEHPDQSPFLNFFLPSPLYTRIPRFDFCFLHLFNFTEITCITPLNTFTSTNHRIELPTGGVSRSLNPIFISGLDVNSKFLCWGGLQKFYKTQYGYRVIGLKTRWTHFW